MTGAALRRLARTIDSVGLWIALGTLGLVLALGVTSTMTLVRNTAWVEHTHLVIEAVDDITVGILEATNARRGFSLTGDPSELGHFTRATRELDGAERRVRALTTDNSSQQRRLDALHPVVASRVARQSLALEYRRTHGFDPEREALETRAGAVELTTLNSHVADLVDEERTLLGERERRTAKSVVVTRVLETIGAGISFALMTVVVVRLRREIGRRERSERAVLDREQSIARLNDDLERRVEERTAEVRMANRELESFGYSVVHDLRAPLRGIAGFAEILLEDHTDVLNADARDGLAEIRENALRMGSLIDALVSMSRILRSDLNRTHVDLTGLVHAVAATLAKGDGRPTPTFVVEPHLQADVDPDLARALVEVLVDNSMKFAGNTAAPRIEIGVLETDAERAFFVRDNGAGFDMAHADKLFTPFGRLHRVGEFPGIGIGLATAERIVHRHGGRIWADAHVGDGATFYFTFGTRSREDIT